MSHRLLKVDCPLLVVADAATQPEDDDLIVFTKTVERTVEGRRRYYYAAAGQRRVLIVMRNGMTLESLNQPDAYIKALVGWDPGSSEFALPPHEGKQHTKISVDFFMTLDPRAAQMYAREAGFGIESLADVLNNAPRADRPGGARGEVGRKQIGEQPMKGAPITLLPEQWEIVKALGQGNASAGVRFLVDEWRQRNGGGA